MKFTLKSREATLTFGRTLGSLLAPGDVVALTGGLGAGKTTLTQGVAAGLGVNEEVTSPTFTLIHEYSGRVPLFHFDTYRLTRPLELAELGFDEYIERGGVAIVEWADRIEPILPSERIDITMEQVGDDMADQTVRRLIAVSFGARHTSVLQSLAALPNVAGMRTKDQSDGR
jgi:tRNA threonylcarbamoyladenosine biosynthesis protein TsaE